MTDRPSVLLTRRWPDPVEQVLAARYDVTTNPADRALTRQELAAALQTFDIVCPTITDRIDAAMIGPGPLRVRALCNFGAGVNHIDLAACDRAGLVVTNTPDVLTDDTADLAMMLALMCARRAGEGERLVRSGAWQGWAPTHMMGSTLSAKAMGIVGFGRIGQATARRARDGFGMNIAYAARDPAKAPPVSFREAHAMPVDHLFAHADVISLHIPGGPDTRGLVDARRLSLMKPTAILINTARGDVIDEDALIAALEHRKIGAAGLDVYPGEPAVQPRLTQLENVVLLPHLGSATIETRTAMGLRVLANLDAIVAGRPPPDAVGATARSAQTRRGS
jgi:lactate dehydrogenase-like 2-hydroxyacid dehydrogenase